MDQEGVAFAESRNFSLFEAYLSQSNHESCALHTGVFIFGQRSPVLRIIAFNFNHCFDHRWRHIHSSSHVLGVIRRFVAPRLPLELGCHGPLLVD